MFRGKFTEEQKATKVAEFMKLREEMAGEKAAKQLGISYGTLMAWKCGGYPKPKKKTTSSNVINLAGPNTQLQDDGDKEENDEVAVFVFRGKPSSIATTLNKLYGGAN